MSRSTTRWPMREVEGVEVIVVRPEDRVLWRQCETLEYSVFLESGYVEENPTDRLADFDCYTPMVFLAAFTGNRKLPLEQRRLSGVVRLVYAPHARKMGPGLFPTIDHAKELEIPPENLKRVQVMNPRRCIDIATMVISKEKRDANASKALISKIMTWGWEHPHLRYAFAAIDTLLYRKLRERRLPFEDLGPSVMYMGSETTATVIDAFRIPNGLWKFVIPLLKLRGYWRSCIREGYAA